MSDKHTGAQGELKPCPFCGSISIDQQAWSSATKSGPGCDDCGALAYSAKLWNRRAPAAQASATIQAAPAGWEPVYMTWNDTIMAWVDVGLAEYEAAEPEERRTTYQPTEVN